MTTKTVEIAYALLFEPADDDHGVEIVRQCRDVYLPESLAELGLAPCSEPAMRAEWRDVLGRHLPHLIFTVPNVPAQEATR